MLHSMRWSNIGSIYFGSVWPCMAWIVFTLLCLSRHIRPANDVFCTRRSNLLQRRLSKVSFRVPKTLQQLSSENSINAIRSYFLRSLIHTDSHNVQNVSEKSHQPIGFDERSILFFIWHVFRATPVTVSCRRAKNLPLFRIKFCVANTI